MKLLLLLILLLPSFFFHSCQAPRLTEQEYGAWLNEKKELLIIAKDTVNAIQYELAYVPNEVMYLNSNKNNLTKKEKKQLINSNDIHFVLTVEFPQQISSTITNKYDYLDNELLKTLFSMHSNKITTTSNEVYFENALQSMKTQRFDIFFDKMILNNGSTFIFKDQLYNNQEIIFQLSKMQTMNLPKIKY